MMMMMMMMILLKDYVKGFKILKKHTTQIYKNMR